MSVITLRVTEEKHERIKSLAVSRGVSVNKLIDEAMKMLVSKIQQEKVQKQIDASSDMRRNLVGSGDRSERIRTYNFPQGRMTDHRINLTLYKLDAIMQGDLDELLDSLLREQADLMASVSGEE